MSFVTVTDIQKRIDGQWVLHPLSLSLEKGDRLAIAGATGSGKTTLLKLIGGWEQPDGGTVHIAGQQVKGAAETLIPGHPGVVWLSQQYDLPHHLRVEQVLEYASKMEPAEAEQLYRTCDIEHLLQRKTHQLSGGEMQRIALARLLSTKPQLLLLDEPFSNLDRIHKQVLKTILDSASAALGLTIIIVSHDPADLLPWADRLLLLQEGRVVQEGDTRTVYTNPVSPYAASLLGTANEVDRAWMAAVFGQDIDTDRAWLRPEAFALQSLTTPGVSATVTAVQYLGAYSEVTVAVAGRSLIVHHTNGTVQPGQVVTVQFLSEIYNDGSPFYVQSLARK